MEEKLICPKCGGTDIGEGEQVDEAKMYPRGLAGFSRGSVVVADICTDCGYILGLWVEKPELFKSE